VRAADASKGVASAAPFRLRPTEATVATKIVVYQ
jgi:hypothetical protein